jgi:hypothetical protein
MMILLLGSLGCVGAPEQAPHARMDRQFDAIDGPGDQRDNAPTQSTVRSQSPVAAPNPFGLPPLAPAGVGAPSPVRAPEIMPASATAPKDSTAVRSLTEYEVRIVATIGTQPIYEREVREAVYQRLPEFMNLGATERKAKEHELFKQELRKMVERELILDELFSMLNSKKQTTQITQLKEGAAKEADHRLREFQKRAGVPNDEVLKEILRQQGLTIAGMRRNFERGFMMGVYINDRIKPKINGISLADLKDYYAERPDEFMNADRVKWQDLFVRVDYFRSRADCRKYADLLAERARRGEDFAQLINQFDQGIKSPGGYGYGEEKGKISPPEVEPTVFALKQGQIAIVEFESGFHVVRIAERTYAGKKPFDEQVQSDIRRKLQGRIAEEEYHKIVDALWRRLQPQILVD